MHVLPEDVKKNNTTTNRRAGSRVLTCNKTKLAWKTDRGARDALLIQKQLNIGVDPYPNVRVLVGTTD